MVHGLVRGQIGPMMTQSVLVPRFGVIAFATRNYGSDKQKS